MRTDRLDQGKPSDVRQEHLRMSVGDTVSVSDTISDTVGGILEALAGRLLLVRIDVELDEQEQVTGQNTTSEQGGSLGPSTVTDVRQAPVLEGEPRVGYKSQ
jgi:hypothetical protein